MVRVIDDKWLVGTVDDICFYCMDGQYYARKKSSLTGKKFWRRKCFQGSRRSCHRFGEGNALAAMVYKQFKKQKELWFALKKQAIVLLKEGKNEQEVLQRLMETGYSFQPPKTRRKRKSEKFSCRYSASSYILFVRREERVEEGTPRGYLLCYCQDLS